MPYLVQRTSMECVSELAFRRYSFALSRSLRLDAVLGHGRVPSALDAVATSDLTLEAHAGALEKSARRCYDLVSRKVFSLPKLLLLPSVIATHPAAFAAGLPVFIRVAKGRLVLAFLGELRDLSSLQGVHTRREVPLI